jgi:putative ABC transport system substrate-binding protein
MRQLRVSNRRFGSLLSVDVRPKKFELMHEVVPTATIIAVLINPTRPDAESRQ